MSDFRIITTPEELEALAREDDDFWVDEDLERDIEKDDKE